MNNDGDSMLDMINIDPLKNEQWWKLHVGVMITNGFFFLVRGDGDNVFFEMFGTAGILGTAWNSVGFFTHWSSLKS